jgi:putative sugar O-methyltransferase
VLKENEEIISFNSLVSMHQVSLFIEKYDDTRISSVVELGAGLGNFSRIFRKYIETNHYTILDLPVMMKFSKKFLDAHGMKQEYIESDNFESLKGRIFSLFVSNICMSEMPKERCQGIIDVVWPNCKRLFIIDGHDEPFNSWLSGQIVKHFDKVQVFPYLKSMWKGQKVYVGQKL